MRSDANILVDLRYECFMAEQWMTSYAEREGLVLFWELLEHNIRNIVEERNKQQHEFPTECTGWGGPRC